MAWLPTGVTVNQYGGNIVSYVGATTDVLSTLPTQATAPALGLIVPAPGSTAVTADGNLQGRLSTDDTWVEIPVNIPDPMYYNSTVNAYTFTTLISAFTASRVTVSYVNSTGATGFPGSVGGVLVTYRLAGNGYDRQIFYPYGKATGYTRYVGTDGSWGQFIGYDGNIGNIGTGTSTCLDKWIKICSLNVEKSTTDHQGVIKGIVYNAGTNAEPTEIPFLARARYYPTSETIYCTLDTEQAGINVLCGVISVNNTSNFTFDIYAKNTAEYGFFQFGRVNPLGTTGFTVTYGTSSSVWGELPTSGTHIAPTLNTVAAELVSGSSGSTGSRPVSAGLPRGSQYFDTTLGKPIWLKTAWVKSAYLYTISAGATSSGTIKITLNGVDYEFEVTAGDTIADIETQIRAGTYSGWTVSGISGAGTVYFEKDVPGAGVSATFTDVDTTGVTISITAPVSGVDGVWVDATGTTA